MPARPERADGGFRSGGARPRALFQPGCANQPRHADRHDRLHAAGSCGPGPHPRRRGSLHLLQDAAGVASAARPRRVLEESATRQRRVGVDAEHSVPRRAAQQFHRADPHQHQAGRGHSLADAGGASRRQRILALCRACPRLRHGTSSMHPVSRQAVLRLVRRAVAPRLRRGADRQPHRHHRDGRRLHPRARRFRRPVRRRQ